MGTTPELIPKYNAIFQEQLKRGIIEKIGNTTDGTNTLVHYIPHHAVIREQRATTKVRIVFDASAKSKKSNPSLNDCLYRGPVMLQNLVGLLLRFRISRVAIVGDIEKAFLQIGLLEPDRDVVRFIWLKDPTKLSTQNNLQIYRFARVPFGVVSSPFLLGATISYHLQQEGSDFAKNILHNIYVDNVFGGSLPMTMLCNSITDLKHCLKNPL